MKLLPSRQPQINIETKPQDSPMQTIDVQSEDLQKWEMEVSQMIDKKIMEMQGMILNEEGVWVESPSRRRIMNSIGAWEFKQEINSRVFLNMQMSDLSEVYIRRCSAMASKVFAHKLADNWKDWEVTPLESNMESICWQLFDMIYICLNIAKNEGMRKHRASRGVSRQIQQPIKEEGMF